VKANLARFTTAIVLLASRAMSLGAGIRWWDWSKRPPYRPTRQPAPLLATVGSDLILAISAN
jgi:hypothetical protein